MNYFNYFSEIEETFIRRRGKNLFLSPIDWALMETWQERKIPLHIVLRGIEKVFDNYEKSKKTRTIKGLSFCREEIEAQYEEWLESQVGKNDTEEIIETEDNSGFSSENVRDHLKDISTKLENAHQKSSGQLKDILENVIFRLQEIEKNFTDNETLENDLTVLEKTLDDALLANIDDQQKAELENQLSNYKKQVEPNVYQQTFDLMLLKNLREQNGIPRLSLFYF